jgi:transposase
VQYGPVMCAVIIYLFMGQFLSKKRTAQAIGELFGIPVSDGTVAAVTARAAGDLTEFLVQVNARIKASLVVHFDETGLRCQGRNHWLHSASTPRYSRLFFHRRRGVEAMNAMGILPGFSGTAVHDAWAPYDTYPAAEHALCNSHVLRELQAVTDHHATTDTPNAWCWADQVTRALLALHKAAAANPDQPVPVDNIDANTTLIRHALLAATHPAGAVGRKHAALARRIQKRVTDYLKFARDPAIPFTNNAAEQEIRMTKIRQKISGTMRTERGAGHFADLRSYLQTTAKHGIQALAALTQLTSRNPWLPGYP